MATGIAFETPEGIVVHTGDFKLDPTPIDGVAHRPRGRFAGFGRRGVRLLLADSDQRRASQASCPRRRRSLVPNFDRTRPTRAEGRRHHRLFRQPPASGPADPSTPSSPTGGKLAFLGRSMLRISEIAGQTRCAQDS